MNPLKQAILLFVAGIAYLKLVSLVGGFRQGPLISVTVKKSRAEENIYPTHVNSSTHITAKDHKAKAFYKYHHDQMNLLLNESSMLDWKAKKAKWLTFFDYDKLNSGTTVDTLQSLPPKKYRFFQYQNGLCLPAKLFTHYYQNNTHSGRPPLPHVLLSNLGNDFGAFSTHIRGVTANYGNLIRDWKKEGCSKQLIFDYLNHPDTLAVFTTQFHIFNHPKVISLALGLKRDTKPYPLLQYVKTYSGPENRTYPLMINMETKGRPALRSSALQHVVDNFRDNSNISLVNSYRNYGDGSNGTRYCHHKSTMDCYYSELLQSKFILSPSGLGLDCYRHWEAMLMGVIPILERSSPYHQTDGWAHKTLAELPVVWIDQYKNLTPLFLEQEYDRLVCQVQDFSKAYNYRKLTLQYWVDLAYSVARGDTVLAGTKSVGMANDTGVR